MESIELSNSTSSVTNSSTGHLKQLGFSSEEGKEPDIHIPHKTLAIHLLAKAHESSCMFWLGFFKKGELSANQLLAGNKTVEEIFEQAAEKGLNEDAPVMLSDTSNGHAQFFYLLPFEEIHKNQTFDWLQDVVKTIGAWSVDRVGIDLSASLVSTQELEHYLLPLLRQLAEQLSLSDYYLLYNNHGLHYLLNCSLKAKQELASQNISTFIFH